MPQLPPPGAVPVETIRLAAAPTSALIFCSLQHAEAWHDTYGGPLKASTPRREHLHSPFCAHCVHCGERVYSPSDCLLHGAEPCPTEAWSRTAVAWEFGQIMARVMYGRFRRLPGPAEWDRAEELSAGHGMDDPSKLALLVFREQHGNGRQG